MKTPAQLIQEDKVTFYGCFPRSMVYINEAVTEAIEDMSQTGFISVETTTMLERIKEFGDLLGYKLDIIPDADGDNSWYDIEVLNWQARA